MAKKPLTLASAEEIRGIAERALAHLDQLGSRTYDDDDDDDDDDPDPRQGRRRAREDAEFRGAKEALRFASIAAGLLGDARLVGLLARILEQLDNWDNHAPDDVEASARGLTLLLEAGAPVDGDVEELAEHRKDRVRAAVAEGLSPRDARSIALLEKLSQDRIADVRRPAKAALAEARAVPWWVGKFESDPAGKLSPEEALQHKETLEKLSALLDEPRYAILQKDEEIAALAGTLPDTLAIEVARVALSGGGMYDARLPALGAMMLARAGGVEAFICVCEAWSKVRHFMIIDDHVQMVASAPAELRERACLALARYAASQEEDVRTEQGGPAHLTADIAGKAFPPAGDLLALLDIMLAIPNVAEHTIDWAAAGLSDAFESAEIDPSRLQPRLIEARLAGFPGQWQRLSSAADVLLAKLPADVLRTAAEQAMRSEDDDTARWGLARLLFEAYDPERDPEQLELARRFCEDPRFRRLLLDEYDLRNVTSPYMRRALRAGELSFVEATLTLGMIDSLWGGLLGSPFGRRRDEEEEEGGGDSRDKLLARFAPFLGPAELHGPVTDEEWIALRRARSQKPLDDRTIVMHAFSALPPGPWHPEDQEMFDTALAACEAGRDWYAFSIAAALSQKASEDQLPIFERLLRAAPRDRYLIRRCRNTARERLGVTAPIKPLPGEAAAPREWMDEPDDEADGA
jgi:hypothetical protein